MTFSPGQLTRASEIFGNLSVAWFSAGVIAPFFTRPQSIVIFGLSFGVSMTMAVLSFIIALQLAKGYNS